MMVRLVSPDGVVVSVTEEKAARLGWEPYKVDRPEPPKPARKPRAKKKD